jgi:apolipoprotein N-acyltransferase
MMQSLSENTGIIPQTVLSKRIIFLFPVVSALLVAASFPVFNLGFLAWFGLAPLFFALRQRGLRSAAGIGLLFGVFFSLGAFFWINKVIPVYNFFIWLIIFSLYFPLFGVLYKLISRAVGPWLIVGAPALWVSLEYIRSNLFFLSWPWNLLGHSQYLYPPIIQIADITGVYGISFIIVMVNQFFSQLPELFMKNRLASEVQTEHKNRRVWITHILAVTFVLMFMLFYGWYRLAEKDSNEHIRMAIVQSNVQIENNMSVDEQVEHLRVYEQLTLEASKSKPDIIIWPASSLPAPINSSRLVRYKMKQIANEVDTYLLVGGAGHEKFEPQKEGYLPFSNSEFLISPAGRVVGQYNKIRLLPFDEYLPFQGKITWPSWLTSLKESYLAGDVYTLFEVAGKKFSTPICWENMFPDMVRPFVLNGAQFLVSATNESFFGRSAGPYQALAMNVFRAVENRRIIARASATGISVFINQKGAIIQKVKNAKGDDLFVSGIIAGELPLSNRITFYTIYGDFFAYILIGITTLCILVPLSKRKKD